MKYTHDLIVIGAGSGGLGAAGFGAAIGLKVALIDRSAKNFGGDCLNYGCVPSKALLHVASLFAGGKQAERFGLKTSGQADFPAVMRYVHEQQDIIRAHETPEYLEKEYGLESIIGEAKFSAAREVTVNDRKLTARRIVLATGSVPRHLEVPGADDVRQWDNESLFWELDTLPEHLLIVGGGPISCEMAQAFVRLGSKVTLLVRAKQLLEKDPAVMGNILANRLRQEGVDLRFETTITKFDGPHSATLNDGQTITFTHLLAAIGREVRTEGIGLAAAGIEVRDGKIVTDDYYRTTNPHVYTVGDAYGREMFSHGAEKHNTDLWNNFLSPLRKKHRLEAFSWVTFTDPEIAVFGQTPRQLREAGIDFDLVQQSFDHDDRAVAADYREGHLMLCLSKGFWGGGKILGGAMAAPGAGEMIQELQLLQLLGKKYSTLTNKIYAYPVGSRINQKPARDRTSEFLLSDRVTSILRWFYRLKNR
ncbi:FAD-dependent oxidoreductase [Lewinella sp. W8]|uniref:FAD-dependent oxidoreductase n=1 Tax=Lewinella sp. W8 TaxID=2528208 RepID=UPI00106822DD|nr:FAD-dependent oxidoreductase [Lewinella sp. W8]MTB49762.1 NAD(P)/FAD-dependent oxidoreductase [Lewinella sp. W8]